jgi:GNAT superfamily N-acetyltransferase
MSRREIRRATAGDLESISRIMFAEPAAEMIAMTGDLDCARRFGRSMVALALRPDSRHEVWVVDELGDGIRDAGVDHPVGSAGDQPARTVGVLIGGLGTADSAAMPRLAMNALRVLGLRRLLRMVLMLRRRAPIDQPVPADAWCVNELHVDLGCRGAGIGTQLLAFADERARATGAHRLVLSTLTTNPARRLYERNGYVVSAIREDENYERIAGASGRVHMEKELL